MTTSGADLASHGVDGGGRRCLVTGGAGFIGCNLADALLRAGLEVCVLDDLSRPGVVRNLDWLRSRDDGGIDFLQRDVRDAEAVERAVAGVDVVFHLAGQTAVTTSVLDPRGDFEANALGMLNVLEAARRSRRDPIVVYASTNKVYGGLEQLEVVEEPTRYAFADLKHGIDERQPLAPHSPYACSKGAADQYALDYYRIYGVRTVVFRQSCIYGPRQLGSEEQGWVAWFLDAARDRRPVTVFGNGKQVRDLLHVDDLVEAYTLATAAIGQTAGEAYNIGGGAERTLAIWAEFEPLLAEITGRAPDVPRFEPARPGDQRVFFCDTRKAAADFGWRARVSVREGVAALAAWMEGRTDSSADPRAAG